MSKANHNKIAIFLLNVFLMLILSGCIAQTHHREQSSIRETILKLTEEQIVDNLIRCREGYPMIHIKYKTIEGTVTLNKSGGISSNRNESSSVIDDLFGFSAESKQTNALKLVAEPVYNNSAIYDLYKNAADKLILEGRVPDDLQEIEVIRRRFNGKNYYILLKCKEQKKAFGELCYNILNADLSVPEKKVIKISEVTCKEYREDASNVPKPGIIEVTFEFDKKVRNVESKMKLSKEIDKLPMIYKLDIVEDPNTKYGEMTSKLVYIYQKEVDNIDPNDLVEKLKDKEVEINTDFKIEYPEQGILEQILEELKVIRLKD
ncbi:MAG: hypothetical protein JXA96_08870 [Sedimentisphaerales bacterium]|nr:hypothetical protein [Sedimentisphaerales bacterium]